MIFNTSIVEVNKKLLIKIVNIHESCIRLFYIVFFAFFIQTPYFVEQICKVYTINTDLLCCIKFKQLWL